MAKPAEEPQDTFNDIVEAIDALETEAYRHLSIQIDNSLRDAIRANPSAVRSWENPLTVSGLGNSVLQVPSYTDHARAAGKWTDGSGSVRRRR